jgi:hypothetical protein
MDSDQHYWHSVESGLREIEELVIEAKQYFDRVPQVRRWDDSRQRVKRFFHGRFEQRARKVYELRNAEIQAFYDERRPFTGRAIAGAERLRGVLPDQEVERLKGGLLLSVEHAYRALESAKNRLEDFWQARPSRNTPLPGPPESLTGRRYESKPPRRIPDLQSSRERIDLATALASELATIKKELGGYRTVERLKQKHPEFVLWKHIGDVEVKELVEGAPFTPKTYAENLTLRKFGITSRETLKKDRRKLRKAQKPKQV